MSVTRPCASFIKHSKYNPNVLRLPALCLDFMTYPCMLLHAIPYRGKSSVRGSHMHTGSMGVVVLTCLPSTHDGMAAARPAFQYRTQRPTGAQAGDSVFAALICMSLRRSTRMCGCLPVCTACWVACMFRMVWKHSSL